MEATAPQNDKNWKPPHPRQSPLSKSPSNSENHDRSRMDARRDLFGFGYIKPSASASASEDPRAERNNSESRTPTQAPSEEQAFTTPPKITHEEIKKKGRHCKETDVHIDTILKSKHNVWSQFDYSATCGVNATSNFCTWTDLYF